MTWEGEECDQYRKGDHCGVRPSAILSRLVAVPGISKQSRYDRRRQNTKDEYHSLVLDCKPGSSGQEDQLMPEQRRPLHDHRKKNACDRCEEPYSTCTIHWERLPLVNDAEVNRQMQHEIYWIQGQLQSTWIEE